MYSDRHIHWLRRYNRKLDSALRRKLMARFRPRRYVPCFLHRMVSRLINDLAKEKIIIEMNSAVSRNDLESWAEICRQKRYGKVNRQFKTFHGFAMQASGRGIQQMVQDDRVKKVYLDREVRALLDVASPSTRAEQVWAENVTGKGVTVAVLDTGIHPHEDIKQRIVAFKDFINQSQEPYDDNGHGTHVAGDIAANGLSSAGQYRGPAPEAQLVGVKVLNKTGGGSLSTLIEGVEWCIEHKQKYGIQVLNLSLGAQAISSWEDDPLCRIAEQAWAEGLVVCAAAGNEGPDSGTIGSPGMAPSVITVGAMDDQNTTDRSDDEIAAFSSRGPTTDGLEKPDVVAPGADIVSLRAPGAFLNKQLGGDGAYVSMSGTSMSTPVCAGVVALMLEAAPHLTPDEVKNILQQTAEDRGEAPNVQGRGYIDAQKAVDGALNTGQK